MKTTAGRFQTLLLMPCSALLLSAKARRNAMDQGQPAAKEEDLLLLVTIDLYLRCVELWTVPNPIPIVSGVATRRAAADG